LKVALARIVLFFTGWRLGGEVPRVRRYVLIAAPHTSNWDLLHLVSLAWSVGIPVRWMGKHQLFRGPFGPLMRWLGGVPVRRDRRNDLVAQMVEQLRANEDFALTVPAEGTRGRTEHWKSGFYRIALAAQVPIVPGYLDYSRKEGGFGPPFVPTGDVEKDMDVLRAFYADAAPRYPQWFGPVRLAQEVAPQDATPAANAAAGAESVAGTAAPAGAAFDPGVDGEAGTDTDANTPRGADA